MEDLEELATENSVLQFNADCIRKRSNWSKSSKQYQFDSGEFDPQALLKDIQHYSPKLHALLEKIEDLDKSDKSKHHHLHKHFIFCDLKSSRYGAKLLAAALNAKGFEMGYSAPKLQKKQAKSAKNKGAEDNDSGSDTDTIEGGEGGEDNKKKKAKLYGKIRLNDDETVQANKNRSFFLLSSVAVFGQPINVANKKLILKKFNQRPENIHGEQARFIIMDSGFKEGIDLFDIKYIHIFEPPVNAADQKQVIGRGTRTCGQRGLKFHPTRGWPLHVFIYDLEIPEVMQGAFLETKTMHELYLKALNIDVRLMRFTTDLEEVSIYGSVDYELNRKIHEFVVAKEDNEIVVGGGPKRRIEVDRSRPPIIANSVLLPESEHPLQVRLPSGETIQGAEIRRMGFQEMRKYIKQFFGDCAWEDVKMENLCGYAGVDVDEPEPSGDLSEKPVRLVKTIGGAADLIQYTPTQKFVQRYFSPQCPVKGMLLWHSVGTGKTCSAIASATASFEPHGYTILWVTRTTLKADIWKNMFDQICNETIRRMVSEEGLSIPEAQDRRMKLLSKAWRIRPMSYKQFSNLVSKGNAMYKTLVKLNGSADPLRKTLLIIDEAHKLYGGGDLSTIERPDMNALHSALMNSYGVSGPDSVRLLLMTATPITENPMELIQLLNLCKPIEAQMSHQFPVFAEEYLDDEGHFTVKGRHRYLDDIAGHISYLNREKDARQFAQPEITKVLVPLVQDVESVKQKDSRMTRFLINEDILKMKNEIVKENDKIDKEFKDMEASRFYAIRDPCDNVEDPKLKKQCMKIANSNIKGLVAEVKSLTSDVRSRIKKIKEDIKNKTLFKRTALAEMSIRSMMTDPKEIRRFREGAYYTLKYKCGKTVKDKSDLLKAALEKNHPETVMIQQQLDDYNERIRELDHSIRTALITNQQRIKGIRERIRSGTLNELEKSVLKATIKDIRKTFKKTSTEHAKINNAAKETLRKTKKLLEKTMKKNLANIRKTIKARVKSNKKLTKAKEKEELKLKKTARKQDALRENFTNETLKRLVDKYTSKTETDFERSKEEFEQAHAEKERVKEEKALKKAEEKEKKRAEKAEEKEKKRAEKAEEKEREKTRKKQEKLEQKEQKEKAAKTQKKR